MFQRCLPSQQGSLDNRRSAIADPSRSREITGFDRPPSLQQKHSKNLRFIVRKAQR